MDKGSKTLRDQLQSLYPDATPVVDKPKRKFLDPKTVLAVEVGTNSVIVKKANEKSYVTSEAQLYHMAATLLTVDGTDSLWFARTPSRSERGDLWVLHNPRALQVMVDPLSTCRSASAEFNSKGKVTLYCYPSRKDYYAEKQDQPDESATRVQPTVAHETEQSTQEGQ